MTFFGLFLSLLFSSVLNASPGAAPLKLIDLLVRETGVIEALSRRGITGEPARSVQTYITNSLSALSANGGDMTSTQLRQVLGSLAVSGDDLRMRNQLMEMLDRSADELSQEDMVSAINSLIYLANRHGIRGSVVLACSECVNESLRRHGFRFTFAAVQNESVQNVLENVVPRSPRDLSNFIQRRMNDMGLGSYRSVPRELISPEEERSLGVFLALAEHGTEAQKDFVQSVLDFSRLPSGEVRLFNPENPHLFWRMFSEDRQDDFLSFYSKVLKEATQNDQANKEEAFFAALARQNQDDPVSLRMVDELRAKNCLFR